MRVWEGAGYRHNKAEYESGGRTPRDQQRVSFSL